MESMYLHQQETYKIIGAAMEVHKCLGCGFSEKVYQDALEQEFLNQGIPYLRETPMQVNYKGKILKSEFVPDFVCYDLIVVELKAVQELENLHRSQAINYAKVAGFDTALLINFGTTKLQYEHLFNNGKNM